MGSILESIPGHPEWSGGILEALIILPSPSQISPSVQDGMVLYGP